MTFSERKCSGAWLKMVSFKLRNNIKIPVMYMYMYMYIFSLAGQTIFLWGEVCLVTFATF